MTYVVGRNFVIVRVVGVTRLAAGWAGAYLSMVADKPNQQRLCGIMAGAGTQFVFNGLVLILSAFPSLLWRFNKGSSLPAK